MLSHLPLSILLLGSVLSQVFCAEVSRPLEYSGNNFEEQAVSSALMQLKQGNLKGLQLLTEDIFSTGLIGPYDLLSTTADNPNPIERRWTFHLRSVIASLESPFQEVVIAELEQQARRSAPHNLPHYLPAPSARAYLQTAIHNMRDRGRWPAVRTLESLLETTPSQPPSVQLYPPGPCVVQAVAPSVQEYGHTVIWKQNAGFIFACDPWENVLWQYRLPQHSQVIRGFGACLISEPSYLSILLEDGTTQHFPKPDLAQGLGVHIPYAWFHLGRKVYRLDTRDSSIHSYLLPDKPVAAPLRDATGQELWLTQQELFIRNDDNIIHRFAHHLPVTNMWALRAVERYLLLQDEHQHTYRIMPFPTDFHKKSRSQVIDLFCRAQRFNEAWTLWEQSADRSIETALRIAEESPQLHAHIDELVKKYPHSKQLLHALHLCYEKLYSREDAVNWPYYTELLQLARQFPQSTFSFADGGGTLSGRAIQLSCELPPFSYPTCSQTLATGAQGGLSITVQASISASADLSYTDIRVNSAEDEFLWARRFYEQGKSPSRHIRQYGDYIIAISGQRRVRIFDAVNGTLLAEHTVKPSQGYLETISFTDPRQLACRWPVGMPQHISLLRDGQTVQQYRVEAEVDWVLPVEDMVFAAAADGIYEITEKRPSSWPEHGSQHVVPLRTGLLFDEQRFYSWE